MKKQFFLLGMLLSPLFYQAQQRTCSSAEHLAHQLEEHPEMENRRRQIETFTSNWANIEENERNTTVFNIPVVVHILYNNNTENISDAQIQSQIDVLNADFRRLNGDASNTPSYFASAVADVQIEFCLASVDPNGNTTNGINRKYTSKSSFGDNDAMKKSSQGGADPWNTQHYLNIWVCDLTSGLLGYAQFPGGPVATDGVVVDYAYFGTVGSATAPFDKGRTTTHEVGHWLNLYHIWGDSNCGNDLVSDTPTQSGPNYSCPSFPKQSCNNYSDMFMNYMDYSDDACMNMFSNGQRSRMRALFGNGGARAELLNSNGCGGASGGGTNPPASYCTSNGNNSSYEWIEKVTINSWNNTSGNNGGYADFTTQKIDLTKDVSNVITLTPGFSSSVYNEYWKIWVDLNQNQVFENSELVYDQGGMSSTSVSGAFTIPSTASLGETRMRVSMKYNGASSACESFNYGEVEDYTVNILGANTASCDIPTGLASSNVTSSGALVTWNDMGSESYTLRYRTVGTGSYSTAVISGTSAQFNSLQPETTYEWSVRSTCGNQNSSYATNKSFTTEAVIQQVSYCTSKGNSTADEYIGKVVIGNFSHTSGNNGGYADFTNKIIALNAGSSPNVRLTPEFTGTVYSEYWRIWIDLNQDGDFNDAGELVFDPGSKSSQIVSGKLTIPSSAKNGITRMRVSMKYNASATPCESFSYGEVEDYSVNITGGSNKVKEEAELALNVFPNPVLEGDMLNLSLDGESIQEDAIIIIYNSMGQEMYRTNQQKIVGIVFKSISTQNWEAGMYYVSIQSASQRTVEKLIVK